MKRIAIEWGARVAALLVGYFVAGILAGRQLWEFIEQEIDPEALRTAVDLIGKPLGLGKITSIDSRLAAIERIVDHLSLPWALFGSALALLVAEWLLRWRR